MNKFLYFPNYILKLKTKLKFRKYIQVYSFLLILQYLVVVSHFSAKFDTCVCDIFYWYFMIKLPTLGK